MIKSINCPHCKKKSSMSVDNPYRPFCSERCKLIDLGEWASETYRVPSEEKPEENQDL
jgi:endogenous inhibitor of DNA gyrase (YacG/DUF329 family)